MNILDIAKSLGLPGIVGVLVGIGLVTIIRPDTGKGSLFLVLLSVLIVVALAAVIGAVRGRAGAGKPPAPPPDT